MTYSSSSAAEIRPTQPPLAVVGISALFPKASNADEFWSNIRRGIDAITEIPPTHWNPGDYFDSNPKSPDMTYARRGGFLSPLPFDPLEFGISPNNLEAIDTSQLLGMVGAKRALEHAGYGAGREFDRSRVGCILGVTGTLEMVIPLGARLGHPRWRQALKDAGVADDVAADVMNRISESYVPWQENSFPGLLGNVVAGRIANRLDLHGTNCVVDAACASSLSAIHLAALELWTGRSDMVVTGGIDTFNDIFMFMCFSKTPALSPTGDAKPFSDEADGTILGEGVGMLVLKRQADAERDGDRIYAILKGIGTSSDGAGNAVYAPKAEGQIRCLQDAYRVAGVSPDTIELVEAHGTGTKVGDATEVSGLMQVYQATGRRGPWCAVGSIKSQIGHTKAAAGSAGVIKAILALQHRVLPPTIKVQRPPAAMLAEDSPFYVNTEPRPWVRSPKHPRRAAVSAFGFGGSNFHCVLEESPQRFEEPDWDGDVQVIPLSATTAGGLIEPLTEKVRPLATADWNEVCLFATQCRSNFRVDHAHRLLFVIERNKTDLLNLVTSSVTMLQQHPNKKSWSTPDGAFYGEGRPTGKLGVLFPGQGSQYVGMFRELTCRFPVMLDVLVEANEVFAESVDPTATDRLSDYIYPQPSFTAERRLQQEHNLRATQIAQPAIGATSLATLALLGEFGVEPEAAAGHSYGELTALCASRRFAPRVLYRLSMLRGQLMAAAQQVEGGMLALGAPLTQIEAALKELSVDLVVANHNSPTQVVLSGRIPEIDRASELFASRNIRGKKLAVAAAFHSPMVAPASRAFRPVLDEVEFAPSQMTVYANSTATEYPADPAAARDLLATQLARPVNFVSEIEQMHADGVRTFLEVGPANVLTSLVNSILNGRDYRAIAVDSSSGKRGGIFDLALALAQLSALGHTVRWEQWDPQRGRASEPVDSRRLRIPICGANYVKARPPIPPRPAISPSIIGAELAVSPRAVSSLAVVPAAVSTLGTATQAALASQIEAAPNAKHLREQAGARVAAPTPAVSQQKQLVSPAEVSLHEPVPRASGPKTPVPQVASESLQQIAMARTTDNETRNAIRQTLASLQRMQEETTRLHQQFLEGQAAAFKAFERLACQRLSDTFEVDAKTTASPADVPVQEVSPPGFTPLQGTSLRQPPSQPAAFPPPESLPARASVTFQSLVNPAANRSRMAPDRFPKTPTPAPIVAESVVPQRKPQPALVLPSTQSPAVVRQPENMIPPSPRTVQLQETDLADRFATENPLSFGATVLAVVSEKTGYPTEMLNLDMSLDHDLGIDSIKRVEILSALQERVPHLPPFQPDELGALHTLRDVVTLADARSVKTSSASPSQPAKPALAQASVPNHASPATPAPSAVANRPVATGSSSAGDSDIQLAPIVLAVVSEKTGYPTEMLNLDMSLDHDLGIDSIKRVEILSALQERVPHLPAFQPDELGALHTLRDVVVLADARMPSPSTGSKPQAGRSILAQAKPHNPTPSTSTVSTSSVAQRETQTKNGHQTAIPAGTGGNVAHATPSRSAIERSVVYAVPLAVGPARQWIPLVTGSEIWITEDHSDLSLWIAHELHQRGLQPRIIPLEGPVPTQLPAHLVGLIVVSPLRGISESQLWDAVRWLQGAGPALRRATSASPTLFATLARLDGRFGFESNQLLHDPISGGLAGLAKCAALEWPEVHSRAIDISPDWSSNQALATRLVAELLHEGPVEVGVTPQGCYALETRAMPLNRSVQDRPISPGDLIVISGGARGVTAEAAFAIAQAWQPRLAILGRSPEPVLEPEWLARLTSEGDLRQGLISRAAVGTTPKTIAAETQRIVSGREISRQLQRLRSLGISVSYHAVDVRDPAVVGPLLMQLQHQWGPVRGIIHGAGVLADQRIEDKTKEQFDRVYQTKIHGLASILNHVDPQELRLLGLFSSYTARFGRIGQLDYAVANEVMNKLARQFSQHYPQCRVASFNWGPWDGGMVQGGLKKLFAAEGVGLIPLEAGADLLVSEFEQAVRQSVEILVLAPPRDSSMGAVTSGDAIRPHATSAAMNPPMHASPVAVRPEVKASITSAPAFRPTRPVASDGGDDLKVALEFDLDVAKYPFLESHVIGGKAVLPVAMILEWMAHAAIHLNPGLELQGFNEFRVYQGIRLGPDDRVRLKVLLGKTIRTEARFIARVQLVVQAHGREVLHAGGQVVLSAGYPVAPSPMLVARGEQYSLNLAAAYDQRLFHGPMFQGLLSIESCSAAGIVVTAGAATAPGNWMSEPTRGTWLADPLAIDVALQAIILWSQEMRGQPCLPCAISNYRQYRPVFPQSGVRIVIALREGTHQLIRCDIDFVDQHERLVARMEGCESVADIALVAAFQRNQMEIPTV